MRKSFTWFLSLMVLLTAFTTQGYAQESQKTVELYAEDASYCYNEANTYSVTISVRDFINLNKFELNLGFNNQMFEFKDISAINPALSGVSPTVTGGVVTINWNGETVKIGDNVKTDIFKVNFKVLGYPGNDAMSFTSDLKWGATSFYYGTDKVNTDVSTDGSLKVNVGLSAIDAAFTTEECAGGNVTVKVTAPGATHYLFNEGLNPANWTNAWTTSNEYKVKAGETVTVRVKDANGCISLRKVINVPVTVEPLSFTVTKQDPACYQGKGSVVIHAKGGTAPYTYYIRPLMSTTTETTSNFQFSLAPGTWRIAVQDANECANLDNLLYWQTITINANNTLTYVNATASPVACFGESNGSVTASTRNITEVSLDGGKWFPVSSNSYTFTGLAAGKYVVKGRNANGCQFESTEVTVAQPTAPITFNIKIEDTTCGGEEDGSIEVVNVAGGNGGYQYSLDGENWGTASLFEGLEPIYYSVWVKDSKGCIAAYSNPNGTGNTIAVQSPEDINYTVVITQPACNDDDATVKVTNITGGSGDYVILFNDSAVEGNIFTWEASYDDVKVTVKNKAGVACAVTKTVTSEDVKNPEALTAEVLDFFAPTCIDGNDGSIRLEIKGGTKPYYYSINGSAPRATSNAVTNIRVGVGSHTITVKDANGCEVDVDGIPVVIELEKNIITAEAGDNIECFGAKDGTITFAVTSWVEAGRTVKFYVENAAGHVTALNAGDKFNAGKYTVWAVDEYTCESNKVEVVITQNEQLLIADVTTNGASCFNTFEGTISVYATGGTPFSHGKLEYAVVNNQGATSNIGDDKWLPFDTYDNTKTPALSTVSFKVDGGTYWIVVRDACEVEKVYGPVEVEGYEELLVDEDEIESTDPLCYGASNGTITVPMSAVSGGAGSYKFTLFKSGVAVTAYTKVATGHFTGLAAGTYTVLVEDAENCPSYTTEEAIVLVNPAQLSFTTRSTDMTCFGANDGTITVEVTGGTPGYSYAINNQNVWVPFGKDVTSKTYIATEPGKFKIWVKDANGCVTEFQEVEIIEPAVLDAEITVTDAACYGIKGQISVKGIGGWAGTTYEYKVNNGTWKTSTSFEVLAGNHILYVRDGLNSECVVSVPFTVKQPEPITYDVVINDVSCKDGEDGTFTVKVLSGGTPFTGTDKGYKVSLTGLGNTVTAFTGEDFTHTFTGLKHAFYSVEIEDANGCKLAASTKNTVSPWTTVESWEVQEPATYLTMEAKFVQDATCFGAKDGKFIITADGGTAPYKYYAALSKLPQHILVPAPESTEWVESNEFSVGAGTWIVWVMDANGCKVGGEQNAMGQPVNAWRVKVGQPAEIVWDFAGHTQPTCFGEWDGTISFEITGGSGVYKAHVAGLSAAGEVVDSVYSLSAPIFKAAMLKAADFTLAGVPASDKDGFTVTIIDENGCTSAERTIVIGEPKQLSVELIKSAGSFTCSDAVEGWIEATVDGGTAPYEYQLLKNGAVHTKWQGAASAFLVQIGNIFTVQVKDANGCVTEATVNIQQVAPVVIAAVEDRSCFGAAKPQVLVTATAEAGRDLFIRYQKVVGTTGGTWSSWVKFNGAGTHMFTTELTFGDDNASDGHYNFQVKDENGCISEVVFKTFVPVQHALAMNYQVSDAAECSASVKVSSITGGVKPYVVMVNDEVVEANAAVTLGVGTHVVKVMDAHMCVVEETVVVEGNYVTREVTVETFIGYDTDFVDAEAGVDTVLEVGTHEFVYTYGTCERTLVVTVVEVPRPLTIAEVQGEAAASPWVDDVVEVTGTVTGVVAGKGFFMQDASAAWSGVMVSYENTAELTVGGGVKVVGTVAEVAEVTTILATSVTAVTGTVAIVPVVVSTPSAVEDEKYESVLVQVNGARATSSGSNWTLYYQTTDNVNVNSWLYEFTLVADHYYNVTGIVNGLSYTLAPRMAADIYDITIETSAPDFKSVEFKVYPNPFNDRISIDNHDKLTRVLVTNIAGQRVMDVEFPGREIRTGSLVSGVYVISLFTEDGMVKSERIVKR